MDPSYKWEMRGKPQMTRITGKRNFVTPVNPKHSQTSIAVFFEIPIPKDCIDPLV